jgi:hypothetical protein
VVVFNGSMSRCSGGNDWRSTGQRSRDGESRVRGARVTMVKEGLASPRRDGRG